MRTKLWWSIVLSTILRYGAVQWSDITCFTFPPYLTSPLLSSCSSLSTTSNSSILPSTVISSVLLFSSFSTHLIPPPSSTQSLGGSFGATNEAFDFSSALKPGGALYAIGNGQITAIPTGPLEKGSLIEKEREKEKEKEVVGQKDRARATAETR